MSKTQIEQVAIALGRALGDSKVLVDPDACAPYANDESLIEGRVPDIVVVARSAADVATTLALADRHDVPVTPRAAGTGRSGGAMCVAGGIVLATHALKDVKEINHEDLLAVVQPGVITGQFHATCEAAGLFYPPDPNSCDTCMVGGNIAENAGGPRAFKYGVTREYVLGLEVVLMGGRDAPHGASHREGGHRLRRDGAARRERGDARGLHGGDAPARAEPAGDRDGARALRRRARRRSGRIAHHRLQARAAMPTSCSTGRRSTR